MIMNTQNSRFQKLTNEILAECHEDQEGLWSLIAAIKYSGLPIGPGEMREAVFAIIRKLLDKDIVAMNYHGDQYHVWNLPTEEAIARIDKEWRLLGKDPSIGDIVWFTSKERAQRL